MNPMLSNNVEHGGMTSMEGMMPTLPLDMTSALNANPEDMEFLVFAMHLHSNGDSTLASSDDLRVDFYDVLLMDRSEEDIFLVEIDNLSLKGASMYCEFLESKLDMLGEWI